MLMFPQLLEEDPEMVEGMLNKAMSTTEVTKHLVGQKANFAFMKKVNRLIPSDKVKNVRTPTSYGCLKTFYNNFVTVNKALSLKY